MDRQTMEVDGTRWYRRRKIRWVIVVLGFASDGREGHPTTFNDASPTEDPVKSPRNIAHLVRLQGFALVSYRLRAPHGWRATNRSGCDPYIYSRSQRACAILIWCSSGPSASEALNSGDFWPGPPYLRGIYLLTSLWQAQNNATNVSRKWQIPEMPYDFVVL